MSKARASGAKHDLPPVADPPDEDEAPVAKAGWQVRATRWLLATAGAGYARAKQASRAKATVAVDGAIAGLQQFRQRALGAAEPDERRGRDRVRPGKPTAGRQAGHEPKVEAVVVPKPRRRLRSLLVYLSAMLAGSMIGMVLAYDLLSQLLDRRATELSKQEIKLTRYSKSLKALRKQAERQEKKLTDAEARLAASLAENEKTLAEMRTKQAEAEMRLASAPAAGARVLPGRADAMVKRSTARKYPPIQNKSVDCTLSRGNVNSILKGCIAEMNGK